VTFSPLTKIISGGQTGADRGALIAARALGLDIGGWAPAGWRSEDGFIPPDLCAHMRESKSPNYGLRTRLNIQDSDGTLILSYANNLTGGSKFTIDHVKQQRKPCKHLVLPRGKGVVTGAVTDAIWDWIDEHKISVLNVAGPRESKELGIQLAAEVVIRDLLEAKRRATVVGDLAFADANDSAHFDLFAGIDAKADVTATEFAWRNSGDRLVNFVDIVRSVVPVDVDALQVDDESKQ